MLTRLLVSRFTSQYCLYKNLGAPNFCAGAPVHPVQKVSLEPCIVLHICYDLKTLAI